MKHIPWYDMLSNNLYVQKFSYDRNHHHKGSDKDANLNQYGVTEVLLHLSNIPDKVIQDDLDFNSKHFSRELSEKMADYNRVYGEHGHSIW